MFEGMFAPMHIIVVLVIVLIVFGPQKLPELGRGMGEALRGFKMALHEASGEEAHKLPANKDHSVS